MATAQYDDPKAIGSMHQRRPLVVDVAEELRICRTNVLLHRGYEFNLDYPDDDTIRVRFEARDKPSFSGTMPDTQDNTAYQILVHQAYKRIVLGS